MKSRICFYSLIASNFFILIKIGLPQAGSPDAVFGQDGKIMAALNVFGSSHCRASAVQSDGKIVVAGYYLTGSLNNNGFVLSRSNPDGKQDVTFGTNGIVVTDFGLNGSASAYAVSVQSDGKIIAAGIIDNGSNNDMILARYYSNGSIDSTFGSGGFRRTQIGVDEGILALTTQFIGEEEKIIAAGYSDDDFAVLRCNPDGTLDNSFDEDGIVTVQVGSAQNFATTVVIQSAKNEDKIIALGRAHNGNDFDFGIVRYKSDGTPDSTFGQNGIALTPVGTGNDFAEAAVIQDDNKIVAGGYSFEQGKNSFALVRYTDNGVIDSTFGTNGIAKTTFENSNGFIYSLALLSNDKIIAGGQAYDGDDFDFALAGYNSDGSLDNTFGINGIVITPVYSDNDFCYTIHKQSSESGNEKLIAAGYSSKGGNTDFAIIRYNRDGNIDLSFGNSGIHTISIGSSYVRIYDSALQTDGKIVVSGYTRDENETHNFLVIRYNADGKLDNTFGGGGIVITRNEETNDRVMATAIQSFEDGAEKIVAAGNSYDGNYYDFALARYNANGFLDDSFRSYGFVITDIGTEDDRAYDIVIQQDNKILLAGYSDNGNNDDFALVRYHPDGALDFSFGSAGKVTTPVGNSNDIARSVKVQADGKIIAAGYAYPDGSDFYDFAVVRYNSDGKVDNTFGNNGVITTDISNYDDYVRTSALQNDGKIILAGYTDDADGNSDCALIRYNNDGSTDNTFGVNGIVTTSFSSFDDRIYSIDLQQDGKILATGTTYNDQGSDFFLIRYNNDGSLDNTFRETGVIIEQASISFDAAHSVRVQSDGKIITAGYSENTTIFYSTVTLMRYIGDEPTDISDKKGINIPESFKLSQNYPNPFNPKTKIKISVPASSSSIEGEEKKVTLKVYDILGRCIATLIDKKLAAGTYEVVFDASGLASGMYIYTLKGDGVNLSKKLLLVR